MVKDNHAGMRAVSFREVASGPKAAGGPAHVQRMKAIVDGDTFSAHGCQEALAR